MKFLLDANIPYSSKEILKKFNYKVEHSREIGLGKAADEQIIKYAINNNQILITKDLGFGNIKKYPIKNHKGIILIRVPFYYTANQINAVLSNFFKSIKNKQKIGNFLTNSSLGKSRIKEREIENSLVILEINKYRIRK